MRVVNFPSKPHTKESAKTSLDRAIELVERCEFEDARKQFCKLLDEGVWEAYDYLGFIHECEPTKNTLLDYDKALFYYQKATEVTGSSEAHIAIARMFYQGCFGNPDQKSALNIYQDLIEQGIQAEGFLHFMVGVIYMRGEGVEKDDVFAMECFRLAWGYGHIPSLTLLSSLLWKQRFILKAFLTRIRATALIFFYVFYDENSPKLRTK